MATGCRDSLARRGSCGSTLPVTRPDLDVQWSQESHSIRHSHAPFFNNRQQQFINMAASVRRRYQIHTRNDCLSARLSVWELLQQYFYRSNTFFYAQLITKKTKTFHTIFDTIPPCLPLSSSTSLHRHISLKRSKVKGRDIYVLPLTRKPKQQPFTMQSGVLISISSKQRSAISGRPLYKRRNFGLAQVCWRKPESCLQICSSQL